MECTHGRCAQVDHCECEQGWFGVQCDRKCDKGTFLFTEQRCDCAQGWSGSDLSEIARHVM
jgi:hypothetical protein